METNQIAVQEDELIIDVKGIGEELVRKIPVIIMVAVILGAMAFFYAQFMMQPEYKSTTKMYVLSDTTSATNISIVTDLQISTLIIEDCAELIASRSVMENVIDELELEMSVEELLSKVEIVKSKDTRFISIVVKDTNPVRAKQIADSVRDHSGKAIEEIMGVQAVNTVDEADLPTVKSSMSATQCVAGAVFMGIVLTSVVIIIKFVLRDAVRTIDDAEKKLGMNVLTMIPVNTNTRKRKNERA